MDYILIPTYKKFILEIKSPIITSDRKQYINNIINSIVKYSQNRAVLVIFEYIENVYEINKKLRLNDSIDENKIIIYKDSENKNESLFLNNEITEGTIILSTNLAARGTDIKISKNLEKNGGLHVILTFFPINERIEKQAFGRAGRKGEKGSAEMIIFSFDDINKKNQEREIRENKLYDELINNFSVRDEMYEQLFNQFCCLLNNVRNNDKKDKNEIILDLKEKWGFFLIKNNINNLNGLNDRNKEIILANFKKLMNEINNTILNNNKLYKYRNPLIESNSIKLENLERIVNECKIYSIGANYHVIYLLIKNSANKDIIKKYIDKLIFRLKEFIKFFDEYLLKNLNEIKTSEKSSYKDLEDQLEEKKEMFQYILNNIYECAKSFDYWFKKQEIDNLKKEYLYNINRSNGRKFSQDVINYMYDLGIYFLYKINTCYDISCQLF
jgi:hypothetical protein